MCEFEQDIPKCPTFPAPLRRRLLEPREPHLSRPIVTSALFGKRKSDYPIPPVPVVGPDGKEYFRLSDVKAQIEHEIRQAEQEVREGFIQKVTTYLTECRGATTTHETDAPSSVYD